uniref:Helitron helicase-like domain-containing protein n=1 Tax=Lactuca sativa TaxID=4236 RepID=A0A9R1XHV9_LACSA|nr:hypothetical protein LSAT_V11C400170030 [Lactuca sativa]
MDRCESYENLRNLKAHGNTNIYKVGRHVILPSSFTHGSRCMMQNYLDTMSLRKWFGYLDFFISFTCNPKWLEVKRALYYIQKNDLIYFVVVYIIEFQKRGFLIIPNIDEDPDLYSLVNEFMIHGPCGDENINFPCMVDKMYSKNFPKQLCNHTLVDPNGFPLYRRRNDGHFVCKIQCEVRYQVHINFGWCNQRSFIKCLFKYINNGPNRATLVVVQNNNECEKHDAMDEINQ